MEEVGFYNPVTKERIIRKERVQYWLSKGVQPSPTVYNLLVKDGVVEGKKIAVHKKSKKPAAAASAPASVVQVAAAVPVSAAEPPKEEAPKVEEK